MKHLSRILSHTYEISIIRFGSHLRPNNKPAKLPEMMLRRKEKMNRPPPQKLRTREYLQREMTSSREWRKVTRSLLH